MGQVVPTLENEKTLGDFIFEDILCRWGGMVEIVTNNGPTFIAVAGYLSKKWNPSYQDLPV